MSWVDENLVSGETVRYRARNSWNILLWPILYRPLRNATLGNSERDGRVTFLRILFWPIRFAIAFVIGLFLIPAAVVAYLNNERVVTSHRLICVNKGLVGREVLEINLQFIEGLSVDQGIFSRIAGKGTVVVGSGSGARDLELPDVPDPMEFRRQALAAIDARVG